MIRPVGVSAGGLGLAVSWLGGFAIVRMTGSTPVAIVLAAGLIAFLGAAVVGAFGLRHVSIGRVSLPDLSTQGDEVPIAVEVEAPRPVWIVVRHGSAKVASGWAGTHGFRGPASFPRRAVVTSLRIDVRSAGTSGLVWWRRRFEVDVDEHLVAPEPADGSVPVERRSLYGRGELSGAAGAVAGQIDGVRPWREGDSERHVHWASSMRAGELVVHDRRRDVDQEWVVEATHGRPEPDAEAAAVLAKLEQVLRAGGDVKVAIGDGRPEPIASVDDAARWAARADLGPRPARRRTLREIRWRTEPETSASLSARWWAAGATAVSIAMLSLTLELGLVVTVLGLAGIAAGALVSGRVLVSGEPASLTLRSFVAVGALVAFVMVLAAGGRLEGLLDVLRGPLPMLLVILIGLHGFECHDRRTIRVSLGISGVVMMYASGFRVDDSIIWWLLAWALCFGVSMAKLAGPTARMPLTRAKTAWPTRAASIGVGAVATVGLLAIVPVPRGPAHLTLPTFIDPIRDVTTPGAIVGPDGDVRDQDFDAGSDTDGLRAPPGQAGGYTGFAQSMDTSVRGDLGDEIVMRVRAPEPDFWRGQTFGRFDGRRWYADERIGRPRRGPNIDVAPTLGDRTDPDAVDVERFVQTYYVEADMPNVVFHANRPVQVIIDADVWTREDGAIRASTVLGEGSVYTVVSAKNRVDAASLRGQGLVGDRLTQLGREVFAQYLEVPESTSPATIALADELARDRTSTYDVVLAYEAWMNRNVEYDLDAPLPDPGEDAVHDFLFDTQLGFCEQIASSLTIMLRTQGVPARLATGYVSGTRDRVAGVFEVRASDAHAWVEVWFPETGWQAFDPTAAVPLAADAEIDSVGADLIEGAAGYVGDNTTTLALIAALGVAGVGSLRVVQVVRHRRRRGRWGLLQDRFAAVATESGASAGVPNPQLAAIWKQTDDARVAREVAERLDRVAFDPTFDDADDHAYDETRKLVGMLSALDQ